MTPMENKSEVTEFILLGLIDAPRLQVPLLTMFTLTYLITLVGNLGMITLILLDLTFTLLCAFSWVISVRTLVTSSALTPGVTAGFPEEIRSFLTMHVLLRYSLCRCGKLSLGFNAYDGYAAVCKPLHYATSTTTNRCACLVISFCVLVFWMPL